MLLTSCTVTVRQKQSSNIKIQQQKKSISKGRRWIVLVLLVLLLKANTEIVMERERRNVFKLMKGFSFVFKNNYGIDLYIILGISFIHSFICLSILILASSLLLNLRHRFVDSNAVQFQPTTMGQLVLLVS